MDARTREMAKRMRAGETLAAIGRDYGLTRERVRQVLAEAGLGVRSAGHLKALRLKVERACALFQQTDLSAAEIARRLELNPHRVVSALKAASLFENRAGRAALRRRKKHPHGSRQAYWRGCACARCRSANNEWHRACGRRRRAAGLCWRCAAPAAPGRTMCEKHLARLREDSRRRGRPAA